MRASLVITRSFSLRGRPQTLVLTKKAPRERAIIRPSTCYVHRRYPNPRPLLISYIHTVVPAHLYLHKASVQAQQRAGLRLPQDVIDASNGVQERKPVSRQPASTLRILQRPPHNQGRQSGTYMQRLQPQVP